VVHTISQVLIPTLPSPQPSSPSTLPSPQPPSPSTASIYSTALATGSGLTTLAALLNRAGLATTFSAPGSFTVFAPTNASFAVFPAALLDWFNNTRVNNSVALANTLRYHALSGAVLSGVINASGTPITTLCAGCTPALTAFNVGGVVTVRNSSGAVLATVATPNVSCSNGVVHVVGSVLVPANQGIPTRDVVQTALNVPELSNLTAALAAVGLVPALTIGPSTQSFTVFAPLNSGWSGVPASVASNVTLLSSVLTYHVIVGRVYSTDLTVGVPVVRTTLNGQTLSILRSANGTVAITSASGNVATVQAADIDSSK
jgi:uncharacterized surface protein with fasciclin (FAS1) repeats